MNTEVKFRTMRKNEGSGLSLPSCNLTKNSKITIDAYGSTEKETMDTSPFPWG